MISIHQTFSGLDLSILSLDFFSLFVHILEGKNIIGCAICFLFFRTEQVIEKRGKFQNPVKIVRIQVVLVFFRLEARLKAGFFLHRA